MPLTNNTGADRIVTGTIDLTSTSNSLELNLDGAASVSIFVNGGSGGTFINEVSNDGGTTWSSCLCNVYSSTGFPLNAGSATFSNTANAFGIVETLSSRRYRLRVNATGTGTAAATLIGKAVRGPHTFINAIAPGTGSANLGKAEDAAHSSGDVGIFSLAVRNDSLGTTFCNNNGDYSPVAVSSNGSVFVDGSLTTQPVSLPSAATPAMFLAQTTTVQTVKASAGTLYWGYVGNPNASTVYLQIFDIAGAVTLGTSVPVLSLPIPPTDASATISLGTLGIAFSNAIKLAVTTTANGNTAPGVGATVNIGYK